MKAPLLQDESIEACTGSEVMAIIDNVDIASGASTGTSEPAASISGDYGKSTAADNGGEFWNSMSSAPGLKDR